MFVGDIEEGIAGTGIKAAFLECAIDHQGMTPGVERVVRAVAKAHRRTGVPITVHTHPGSRTGLEVQRVLAEEGVDPRRVVLGHSGDTTDVDHLSELADAGFVLGMDRFGINLDTTFEARADTLIEMCRRGYAERRVLSQDASCYIDWLAPGVMDLLPQWPYTHIHDDVLPYVRERGVAESRSRRCWSPTRGATSRTSAPTDRTVPAARARSRRDAGAQVTGSRGSRCWCSTGATTRPGAGGRSRRPRTGRGGWPRCCRARRTGGRSARR